MTEATDKQESLAAQIRQLAAALGFQQVGFADIDLAEADARLSSWLKKGWHGDMDYMHKHGRKRTHPAELLPDTCSVISVRMDYLPEEHEQMEALLDDPRRAYVSRYALGRDYHKLLRNRLQKLADAIAEHVGEFGYRVFVDSAPVMEKPLANKAGLGWQGKHTNLINKKAGSWFFLGEIYTDLPLPAATPAEDHCGSCRACLDVCPTQAIVAPYQLDARRCISYLTIEHKGSIPEALRSPIGNRIFGCDDCQIFCPWNKFADFTGEQDFAPRHALDQADMLELFEWTEDQFLANTQGSAIRRVGFERWQRNLAVGLGNGEARPEVLDALDKAMASASPLVKEHIDWAIRKLTGKTHEGN